MPFASVPSQGATFSFGGTIGHLTGIDISRSASPIDVSGLDLEDGDPRSYEPPTLLEGDEFKIEAIYSSDEVYPQVGDQDTATFTVGATSFSGDAVLTSVSVKYAVGEVVKLSMTFKVGGTLD